MEDRYKVLVLTLLVLGLGAGAALTTVQNTQPVAPTFSWTFYDRDGNVIPDIHSATISGTVKFKAVLTNTPTISVDKVTLGIFTADDYTFVDRQDFTEVSPGVYELLYDTTTIPDGEYTFEFQYLLETSTVPLSVLTLNFDFLGDQGSASGQEPDTSVPLILTAGGLVTVLALIVVIRRR